MNEWKEQSLSKLAEIRVSNVDKKIHIGNASVKLCNYMNVYSNLFITNELDFQIGSANDNEISRFGLQVNDVIVTKDSETPDDIAVSAVVTDEIDNLVCGYHLAILRPFVNEIDGMFLMYMMRLEKIKKYFYRVANGSTRYGLVYRDIENAWLTYPSSIGEQSKIARVLYMADEVIEKTEAAISKYKAIKSGIMHDLFTRGIDLATGKLRLRYEDAPELYKESELGWVPKEWDVVSWKETCENIFVGIATSTTKYFTKLGVPLIRNQNILENKLDITDLLQIKKEFAQTNKNKSIKAGDILSIRTGYPGQSAVALPVHEGFQSFTTLISRPKSENDSQFLCYLLNSHIGKRQILNLQGGGAQQNLNVGWLAQLDVPKPNIQEQKCISTQINAIESLIDAEVEFLTKQQNLKYALMSDLLMGKVRVKYEEINAGVG